MGFEPTVTQDATTVFKTVSLGRSDIPPVRRALAYRERDAGGISDLYHTGAGLTPRIGRAPPASRVLPSALSRRRLQRNNGSHHTQNKTPEISDPAQPDWTDQISEIAPHKIGHQLWIREHHAVIARGNNWRNTHDFGEGACLGRDEGAVLGEQ